MKAKSVGRVLGSSALAILVFTLITGLFYTLFVTGIGQLFFHRQAEGSVIEIDGKTYGSELLGQQFTKPEHLWGRPMNLDAGTFTDGEGNPVVYAWACNKSPASGEYEEIVASRVKALHEADPSMAEIPIPVDLVTVSGSGLDPEISPAAAQYQVHRIAEARGVPEPEVQAVIDRYTTGRFLGVFGEPRVNVLKVNLALDGILKEGEYALSLSAGR